MNDSRSLEVSSNNPSVIAAIDKFALDLLSMGTDVPEILAHADNHPEVPLLQIYAACVWLYGQTTPSDLAAQRYLARAQELRGMANARELQFLDAIESWQCKEYAKAALALEAYVETRPKDLVAAKILEFLYYLLGQHHSGQRFLRTFEKIHAANANDGYFLASYSFALELTGRYVEATAAALKAVDLAVQNPWAHHTLAHAYLKRGDLSHGIEILESYQTVWTASGQAIHSHNFWHLALMYLEALNHERAFSLLRQVILKNPPDLVSQALDAISLLWRLELAGVDINRAAWEQVADSVASNALDCHIAFNSAHYIYGLARSGKDREVAEVTRTIRAKVRAITGPEKAIWDKVGLPLLDACTAHAVGDHRQVVDRLSPIMDEVPMVGGSDAQDDLFRQMFLRSLTNTGEKAQARAYIEQAFPLATPLQEYWRSLI